MYSRYKRFQVGRRKRRTHRDLPCSFKFSIYVQASMVDKFVTQPDMGRVSIKLHIYLYYYIKEITLKISILFKKTEFQLYNLYSLLYNLLQHKKNPFFFTSRDLSFSSSSHSLISLLPKPTILISLLPLHSFTTLLYEHHHLSSGYSRKSKTPRS